MSKRRRLSLPSLPTIPDDADEHIEGTRFAIMKGSICILQSQDRSMQQEVQRSCSQMMSSWHCYLPRSVYASMLLLKPCLHYIINFLLCSLTLIGIHFRCFCANDEKDISTVHSRFPLLAFSDIYQSFHYLTIHCVTVHFINQISAVDLRSTNYFASFQ
jgi:hypothetical protein